MKNILIVYYSRTGMTKKVADNLKEKLAADIEEVKDITGRSGAKGYFLAGRDATLRRLTKIEPIKTIPTNYDLVIIGTPIWSWNVSVPIRTYITEQKNNFKAVAFFCTMGGSGDQRAFREMGEIIGKDPQATLALKTIEVVKNNCEDKVAEFANKIKV